MEPFRVPDQLTALVGPYPSVDELLVAARDGGRGGRNALAQLWLSEGIPFVFSKRPALYASMREWLGKKLRVNPKEIGLLGSGRLGFALAPKRRGMPFDANSDLDLFIVSRSRFDLLRCEFNEWRDDYDRGRIDPSEPRQKAFWLDSFKRIPANIEYGFIDAHLIPNNRKYMLSQATGDTMWWLIEKLKCTNGAPNPKKASVRYFADWDRLIERVSFNLYCLMK